MLDALDLSKAGGPITERQRNLDSVASGVFVGRQPELEQLKSSLERALSGQARWRCW